MNRSFLSVPLCRVLMCAWAAVCSLGAEAALQADGEYYIWLNIYEKVLGESEDGTAPALSEYGTNADSLSYVFVAEESGSTGYVLLRQKSSGRYLAASSSNTWSVTLESTRGTTSRYCWKVEEGTYSYITNGKGPSTYLGIDGGQKSYSYVSVFYDKPKGSHAQMSIIPAVGNWDESRAAYESGVYTNEQGANEIDYCLINNKEISRADEVDIHLTANSNPLRGTAKVNLGSERTWLVVDNIMPSDMDSVLEHVTIAGEAANTSTNCRVAVWLNGSVVIPTPSQVMTCTMGDTTITLGTGTTTLTGEKNNSMTAFTLRRGYMVTLATSANGEGYSRVYVADHADLEVTLPQALTERVTWVCVKPWQYLSKKGWADTSGQSHASDLRASWFWSWSASYENTEDQEYVPCRQHLYWPSASDVNNKTQTAAFSLNEPEHSEQHESSKCSCGGTIDEWTATTLTPDFFAGGGRIGSPQPTDFSYLTNYFQYVDNMSYRCDFAVTHAYWDISSRTQEAYATWFTNQCKSVYTSTGRPLWITELEIGSSWGESWDSYTDKYETYRQYLQVLLQELDESPWVERYAIYSFDNYWAQMYYDEGGLTPAGEVYRDHRATFAYDSEYTKVPGWSQPTISQPTLTYTINSTQNSIRFTLGNTNGDYTQTIQLEQKVGDEWQAIYVVNDRSRMDNSTFTYLLSDENIDIDDTEFRVTCTTIFGETAESDIVGGGHYIKNAEINTTSKSEVPNWTCYRTAQNGYTKAASGDTYLEVWNDKAANADFDYYQDVEEIPNGIYQLSAVCFNTADSESGAAVNGNVGLYAIADGHLYFTPIMTDSEIDYDNITVVDTIIVSNKTMRVGIRNLGPMGARWAGADNFELTRIGSLDDLTDEQIENRQAQADKEVIAHFTQLEGDTLDASTLIGNATCATGELNRWTTSNLEVGSGESSDGLSSNKYFNMWQSSSLKSSLTQTIEYLPAGTYVVTALLRGTQDLSLRLQAIQKMSTGQQRTISKIIKGVGNVAPSGSAYKYGWAKAEVGTFTISAGDQLTITASTSSSGEAWWSVDDFQLKYVAPNNTVDAIQNVSAGQQTDDLGTHKVLQGGEVIIVSGDNRYTIKGIKK
ncbi:MAG: hypothetical protein Q4E59_03905 [Bacteroidales bacterium]|nr:hypothetical protein [Bacteroidales bacterium]